MRGIDRLDIREDASGAVLAVKVVPGASRDKLAGAHGDCLKITAAAPPEKGKANAAVGRILAEALGVSCRCVQLRSGARSARKEFHVEGLSADAVRQALTSL